MEIPWEGIKFVTSQIVALIFAALYRSYLGPHTVSPSTRHFVSLTLGLCIGFVCFGLEMCYLLFHVTICFLCIHTLPLAFIHSIVFAVAMTFLFIYHFHRAYIWEEATAFDISGPLMIATQKVTILAFSLHDGCYKKSEELTEDQRRHAISKYPSGLEFYSYIFYFQGFVVGPPSFYKDYKNFVEGTGYSANSVEKPNGRSHNSSQHHPSPTMAVLEKVTMSVVWAGWYFIMDSSTPQIGNADVEFARNHNFLYRTGYMMISAFTARTMYYFVWTLGDAVCNLSGFGFSGYDSHGRPKWDLVTNVKVKSIELSNSPKTYIDNWNIQTAVWLKYACYDRAPFQKMLLTFFLSAFWHGCYAGYYIAFASLALTVQCSRKVRAHIRPYFVTSKRKKRIYDVLTYLGTQFMISYSLLSFAILRYQPCISFYNNFYWCLHILAVLILVLPWQRVVSFRTERHYTNNDKTKLNSATNLSLNGKAMKLE